MFDKFLGKNLMGKMGEMQKQMEEIKQKLENISVIGEAENGKVRVVANGNRMINNIIIDEEYKNTVSAENFQETIALAANRALEQAERIEKSEMSHAAMGILPGLG
ncbi:MAG: YbaB/EbfC family nucleoid-associated protein [Flavobacteriales bacterium]|nr:YbaB/EbfC family nucleoid-associated protein [Flavobacteriales bacterium]MCW8912003.1 YbaB/EbfC family nucleoid-associated protein [Flavobacteriales bacterium]MCW8936643.1 YbaB/EbfC family nucleoid-associated protein [Flavobacteriales bacterium]MCW8941390.1 YbaB/EbfC family nucleoid-associated protein [Flavobacteriales bacterium]MCW8968693.1 YbaB/EbfC family nucleoid-associated protein [Flavobacteriales bacterium]